MILLNGSLTNPGNKKISNVKKTNLLEVGIDSEYVYLDSSSDNKGPISIQLCVTVKVSSQFVNFGLIN